MPKNTAEYMREYRARKKADMEKVTAPISPEGLPNVGHRPFAEIKEEEAAAANKAFEKRWRKAGYTSWPPPWSEIIPKMTDEQIVDILEKIPKTKGRY